MVAEDGAIYCFPSDVSLDVIIGTGTWRITPFSKWLVTMVDKSPKDRVVPLISGFCMAYKWG